MIIEKIIGQLNNHKFKNLLLFFCFFYLIVSINSPFYFNLEFQNILGFIGFLRGISPFVVLLILVIFLRNFKEEIKFDIGYFLFFLYLSSQILSYFVAGHGRLVELYWPFCGLVTLLLFFIIRKNLKLNIFFLKFFFIIILILTTKFVFDLYKEYIGLFNVNSENFAESTGFFYAFISVSPQSTLLDQPVPRSSGLSRLLVIIFFVGLVNYIFSKKKFFKKFTFYIFLIFIMFTIMQLQNRLTILFLLILLFLIILLKIHNLKIKEKSFVITCFFILPYLLHLVEFDLRKTVLQDLSIKYHQDTVIIDHSVENTKKDETLIESNEDSIESNEDSVELKKKDYFLNSVKQQRILSNTSSGRTTIWKNSIKLINENFIGYGPQADRVLLDENASNLLIYTLLCGGIFSLISILIFSIIIFYKIIKLIFVNKILNLRKKNLILSILFISFFYLRSITEISFGIFGIDMIIFLLSYNILREESLKV